MDQQMDVIVKQLLDQQVVEVQSNQCRMLNFAQKNASRRCFGLARFVGAGQEPPIA